MRIVTNGRLFAVKCNWFMGIFRFGRYLDLKDPGFWWSIGSEGFHDCWGTEKEAKEAMEYWKN